MRISVNTLIDKLIWAVSVFLFASFYLFESYVWGRYILALSAVAIFSLTAVKNGVIRIRLTAWHGFILLFALFCYFSSLWALVPANAIQMGKTTIQIFICLTLAYVYYQDIMEPMMLINVVKWAGFLVTIYAFLYYGYDTVIKMLADADRLTNSFSNVNTIGLIAAMAIVIQVYEIATTHKLKWSMLFCIPSIVMVAATQSKKALLLMLLGIVLVLVSRNLNGKDQMKGILKAGSTLAVCIFALFLLLQLSIFDGVKERMESLITLVTGEGEMDGSTLMRARMIELGWRFFLENPIGGVGIGCPRYLNAIYLRFNAYLHNNFIELLCGGGILGFGIYYSIYIYLFYQMYRYRAFKDKEYWLCLIMMTLLLVMDYGMVSHYSKQTWFYFLIFFLEVDKLKKKGDGVCS